jgi:hypothetical protein
MNRERALVGLIFCALAYPLIMFVKQSPALAMQFSVYVTLGIFLLFASRNPSANRSLSAQPNPATNKSRIAHAKPIALPRPPRQRLRANPPIASAPAGNTWVLAKAHRRRTCR